MRGWVSILLVLAVATASAQTLRYIAPASGGGSDSNNGLSSGAPWLTPNHALTAPTILIAAAGNYSSSNFQYDWGACTSTGDLCWLKCATFDACYFPLSGTQTGPVVNNSYWGIQGFECDGSATTTNQCFYIYPNNAVEIHHIVFANDIANGSGEGGLSTDPDGAASVDYIAWVGNIAYNTVGGSTNCNSGFDIYEPANFDTKPGTHIYVAGNFAWGNVDGNPCSGGAPTDGEGLTFDTFSGLSYTGQAVADNNLFVANGGPGMTMGGNGSSPFYLRQNTDWGNDLSTEVYCGEILLTNALNTQAFGNLNATNKAQCGGTYTDWAFLVQGTATGDVVYQNWGYSASGSNAGNVGNSFVYGPDNTFGTNPLFANATTPGAPSCGSATSVPNCMATVIANFTPTNAAAKGYGYQVPSSTAIYDPLFPQWLCSVTNLPAGLIENGCLVASNSTGSSTGTMK
jgi:hypothetical protein